MTKPKYFAFDIDELLSEESSKGLIQDLIERYNLGEELEELQMAVLERSGKIDLSTIRRTASGKFQKAKRSA